jgi:hypothetical protein
MKASTCSPTIRREVTMARRCIRSGSLFQEKRGRLLRAVAGVRSRKDVEVRAGRPPTRRVARRAPPRRAEGAGQPSHPQRLAAGYLWKRGGSLPLPGSGSPRLPNLNSRTAKSWGARIQANGYGLNAREAAPVSWATCPRHHKASAMNLRVSRAPQGSTTEDRLVEVCGEVELELRRPPPAHVSLAACRFEAAHNLDKGRFEGRTDFARASRVFRSEGRGEAKFRLDKGRRGPPPGHQLRCR